MSRKYAFAVLPALAAFLAAAPCWAISETDMPAPTGNYGNPQFSDPDFHAKSLSSGADSDSSSKTFGGGTFSFGVTSSHGDGSGFPYQQGFSGRGAGYGFESPDQGGYSNQGFTNQGFSSQGISNGSSDYYAPGRTYPYWAR